MKNIKKLNLMRSDFYRAKSSITTKDKLDLFMGLVTPRMEKWLAYQQGNNILIIN